MESSTITTKTQGRRMKHRAEKKRGLAPEDLEADRFGKMQVLKSRMKTFEEKSVEAFKELYNNDNE